MGTEIFPQILLLMQIVLGAVIFFSLVIIVYSSIIHYLHKDKQNEFKTHIINSLITIAIVLVVYLFLTGIGPAYEMLMIK